MTLKNGRAFAFVASIAMMTGPYKDTVERAIIGIPSWDAMERWAILLTLATFAIVNSTDLDYYGESTESYEDSDYLPAHVSPL